MSLRLAVDLDGVLADMKTAVTREAELLFGSRAATVDVVADPAEGAAPRDAGDTAPTGTDPNLLQADRRHLTARERRKLWHRVGRIEGFWENLDEIEPGAVARLAALAVDRRWEVIFLTQRPETAGATAQIQTQRWLERNGFSLPSVYVVRGSRGLVAEALHLDLVIDDRQENCIDVAVESRAWPVLVWRADTASLSPNVAQLGIVVVGSVTECLNRLAVLPRPERPKRGVFDRLKELLTS